MCFLVLITLFGFVAGNDYAPDIRYIKPWDGDPAVAYGYVNMVKHSELILDALPSNKILTLVTLTTDLCLVECVFTTSCTSVNYVQGTNRLNETEAGTCEILNTDRFRHADRMKTQGDIVSSAGLQSMAHFSIQHECELDEPCPTQNHLCIPDYQTKDFECICKDGFSGEFCTNKTEIENQNLALGRPASASNKNKFPASYVVDGLLTTFTEFSHQRCWWQVTLQYEVRLGRFVFHSRQDCCQKRSTGLELYTLSKGQDTLCYTFTNMAGVKRIEFECTSPRVGNIVKFYRSSGWITIAEIEVYQLLV